MSAGHTVSWSVHPAKKSINFGLFKHPGQANGASPNLAALAFNDVAPGSTEGGDGRSRRASTASSRNDTLSVTEKLQKLGMKQVVGMARCEGDRTTTGTYNVPDGGTAMYGLVFDNTHSKQFSKTVTFVAMTYPTGAPPKSGHHLHFSQGGQGLARKPSSGVCSRTVKSRAASDLTETQDMSKGIGIFIEPATPESRATESTFMSGSHFYTGILAKKRRKRNQGYARRFFSLDFTSSTLSYYKSRNSSALRGAVPISLAVIGADATSRHISIDSGTEVWLLKAHNQKDFDGWRAALEKASRSTSRPLTPIECAEDMLAPHDPLEDRDWDVVEVLVGRVAGITNAVRRLAKDTDPKYRSMGSAVASPNLSGTSRNHESGMSSDYFPDQSRPAEKTSFWRRKSTSGTRSPSGNVLRTGAAMPMNLTPPAGATPAMALAMQGRLQDDSQMHEHCMALLRDLDAVVSDFSTLMTQNRQRRASHRSPLALGPRKSVDSSIFQEFFDAEEGERPTSQLLTLHRDSDGTEEVHETDGLSTGDSNSASDIEPEEGFEATPHNTTPAMIRRTTKSLAPLPRDAVKRRNTIPPSSGPPPSLISFLRKNVGKDLSTIAMPVTSNEPLSLLQRQAEQLEYSELLDAAVTADQGTGERLLYVTAFAISVLSNARIKERAIRKPFNPMLGETFELVREDKGFRYLAEKISHRPVCIACQADAKDWTFNHAPTPSQKFWGKSAELITEGRARVILHESGDCYSWKPATCFLRNLIAGEKYIEPTETMTVVNEMTGQKAVVTFKAGGMFSGRSEDVAVQVFDSHGHTLPLSMQGTWTNRLTTSSGKVIWTVGATVQAAPTRYGMTVFSSQLNETTEIEAGVLPPTDSRLRPDQRAYEEGRVDQAESLKIALEEGQRRRRKEMEIEGREWRPQWFVPVEGEQELWCAKESGGYWKMREAVGSGQAKWDASQNVFDV